MQPLPLSKADLHLLSVFCSVVEARGFSAAQIELNVSTSTISRQISDLELRLGMTLCQRGRSGFLLSEDGEMVYRAAQRLFASVRKFEESIHATGGSLVGTLSVATVDTWVFNQTSPFALALKEISETAPDVTLELFALAPDDIELAVHEGRVALGLGVFHRHRSGLHYEVIARETIGLYCAQGHALFGLKEPERIEVELQNSLYAKRAYLRERDVAPVSRGMKTNAYAHQIEGIAQLILTGQYVGYLPEHFAQTWVNAGAMWSIGVGAYDQPSEIKLVRRRRREESQIATSFEAMVRKYADQQ